MKIAIVNELANGGATRCARDLESHMQTRHDVNYLPTEDNTSEEGLLQSLQQFAPDVVHCHSYFGAYRYGLLNTLSHKFPTCFTAHDPRPVGTIKWKCWECDEYQACIRCPLSSRKRRYSLVFNKFFRQRLHKRIVHQRADRRLVVVTPSDWLRQRLVATEMKRFRVEHIPNGIDLEHFAPDHDARDAVGLPKDKKVILYIGRKSSSRRKGLSYLLEAFVNQISPALPDAMLLSVGEQPDIDHPNVLAIDYTPQDQLPRYYAAADIFVTPTLADNLPYTVIESMAAGTPVVASHVGGIPEQVVHGVTGLLVPPADSTKLATAILQILTDSALRETMATEGRCKVQREYAMETFVDQYEQLYQRIHVERNPVPETAALC